MNLIKKAKEKKLFTVVMLIFIITGIYVVHAAATDPGSDSDPIVTQSYVDSKVNAILAKLGDLTSNTSSIYTVVSVNAGSKVMAGAGAEIILRQGKATAIGSASGGLSDVTLGGDWQTGANIPGNHLLIVPKDDGRGLTAVSDIKILIRGKYSIK